MQHFTLLIREQAQNLTTSGISLQGEVKSPHIMNRKQFIVQVVEWVIEIVQLWGTEEVGGSDTREKGKV